MRTAGSYRPRRYRAVQAVAAGVVCESGVSVVDVLDAGVGVSRIGASRSAGYQKNSAKH